MIDIYVKSGVIFNDTHKKHKNVMAFIWISSRFKWLKALQVNYDISRFQLEASGLTHALHHIKDKFRKKPIRIHTDSCFIHQTLERSKNGFKRRSKLEAVEILRFTFSRFPHIKVIRPHNNDPHWQELVHVYQECGLDDIILDEKE
jgi:ribonuclease HI